MAVRQQTSASMDLFEKALAVRSWGEERLRG